MRKLISACAVIAILMPAIVCAQQHINVDLDLKKTAKEAEADAWLNKGNTAYQAKDYDGAIICYKKATELDPTFASAFYNLGIMYAAKGLIDEAISSYKKVLTIDPEYHAARNNLASIYINKGMVDEALSELHKAIVGSPDFPHAHFNLGECYFAKGNKKEAAEHYYKAGMLFAERGDKVWTQKSYESLKNSGAEDKLKSLLEKMNAAADKEKGQMKEAQPKQAP